MKLPGSKKKKPTRTCPRCNQPVSPDTAFCEACGARIAPPPSCSLCGTLLEPGSRFCPSCGTMVGKSKKKPLEIAEEPKTAAAPVKKARGSRARKTKAAADENQPPDPLMMIPEENESPAAGAGEVPEPSASTEAPKPVPSPAVRTLPASSRQPLLQALPGRKSLVVIAAFVLLLAGIALFATGIVSLPHTAGPGTDTAAVTAIPTVAPSAAATETTAVPAATTEEISFVPGPTEVPPDNLQISLEVNRDPQTKVVSVQYMGGRGQNGVKNVSVRLTRSDGQVLTGSFKPVQVGSGTELQGTEKTDRIEITINYYTGAAYKVTDQVFEYKIRHA
jgi:hypothetical protein